MMAAAVDRLELTRLFLRIVETGSLSAAGRSLGVSQPSVSRQLRQLEMMLGVELVRRSTHELTVTEAGLRFEREGRAMLEQWERVAEGMRGEGDALAGPVRVLAPAGLGQTLLADIAADFVNRHPGITLDWLLDDRPRDLVACGIDLWLRVGEVRDEALVVRPLARMERILVAAADAEPATHPATLSDRQAVILAPFMADGIGLEGPEGATWTLRPRPGVSTDTLFAAGRLVEAGAGWSALPRWLVAPLLKTGGLQHLCPAWHPAATVLSLAYPRDRFRAARVTAFMVALREGVAQGLAAL